MSGGLVMAAAWALGVSLGLLFWPRLLRRVGLRLGGRWPASLLPTDPALAAGAPAEVRALAVWSLLALAASLLPAGSGLMAADLDAGLLWLVALVLTMALLMPRAAVRLVTVVACSALAVLPVVTRVASLDLADVVVAQQGGTGNWFLVREPFLLMLAAGWLLAVATCWPDRDRQAADPWVQALAWGWPLVAAHFFVVFFLGGWWAIAPVLDGLPWLNTALKTLVVWWLLARISRWRWVTPSLMIVRLPVGLALAAVGSLAWLILGGAVR